MNLEALLTKLVTQMVALRELREFGKADAIRREILALAEVIKVQIRDDHVFVFTKQPYKHFMFKVKA